MKQNKLPSVIIARLPSFKVRIWDKRARKCLRVSDDIKSTLISPIPKNVHFTDCREHASRMTQMYIELMIMNLAQVHP